MLTRVHQNDEKKTELILKFSHRCFSLEQRWHKKTAAEEVHNGAEIYVWQPRGVMQGLLVIIPEKDAFEDTFELDPEFEPDQHGMYCSMVAVPRWHRGKGIGPALVLAAALRARRLEYTSLSSHVRTKNGWNERRALLLEPQVRRLIPDFWKRDGDCEFQRLIFD